MNENDITSYKRRPLSIRIGRKLRRHIDAVLASSSLVSNDPVLDAKSFPWTEAIRENWESIRQEALAAAGNGASLPSLNSISPDHAHSARDSGWQSFFLMAYGERIAENLARCPVTAAALSQVPGLKTGFFSVLRPGTHIPRHRGVTKGLLTCHLGLDVPDQNVRMEVAGQCVRWSNGATLIFDDTWPHEVWNESDHTRIVLLIQFVRPMRQPGRLLNTIFLSLIRRSAFIRDARANIDRWNESLARIEAEANIAD